jgi:GMP synthase (glutamine-hydrolysing)
MKALFLRHIKVEGPGLAAEICESLGLEPHLLDVSEDTVWPTSFDHISHVISLGGPMTVYERDKIPWLDGEEAFLKRAMEAGIPVMGICLGAQIIAQMLGGKVEAGSPFELGWGELIVDDQAANDPLLRYLKDLAVFHWHGDRITPPEGAHCLAATDTTPCQAFRVGERTWGLQFHIEVLKKDIDAWRKFYPDENAKLPADFDEQSRLALEKLNLPSRLLLQDFFKPGPSY